VHATYNNYYVYPSLPLREFLFHYSGNSPVNICLPYSTQGIQNGCKITIRTYSGGSHTTFIYGEPTTIICNNDSAINEISLTGFKRTNLIFNDGYWFEVYKLHVFLVNFYNR
jgi:hypothetical protein